MPTRREFLGLVTLAATAIGVATACSSGGSGSAASAPAGPAQPGGPVARATAITEVFGDGQRLVAVALEYPTEIETARLSPTAYTVTGRTITGVSAAHAPSPEARAARGRHVLVELSPDDAAAVLIGQGGFQGGNATPKPAVAVTTQTGPITAADGTVFPASATPITTNAVTNLIVDEFRQFEFSDPATGQKLAYNLFVPRGYDPLRSYPLVLFMHDASLVGAETTATLIQGLGAVCWASPEDQAKRPAFVLAPQYPSVVVEDDYKPTALMDTTVNLVNDVVGRYAIDRNRLYTTGQSMGGMMSIGIDIKYPDLFAASYLVACQWPAEQVAPMSNDKLYIVVSQDDTKAYPGQNAITAALEQRGDRVARAVWDGAAASAQLSGDAVALAAQGAPINYAAFRQGTVLRPGDSGPGAGHMNTWRVAYGIESIRAWIFGQHR